MMRKIPDSFGNSNRNVSCKKQKWFYVIPFPFIEKTEILFPHFGKCGNGFIEKRQ